MELNRINIYINEHLWEYFEEKEKIPIFLYVGNKKVKLTTQKSFQDSFQFVKSLYEKWKMLSIFVDPNMFEGIKDIYYYIYIDAVNNNGRFQNKIVFDEKVGYFRDQQNKMCCYSQERDLFLEFYFLPKVWNISNHNLWSKEFQKDVKMTLFVLKQLSFHKDIKYSVIQALSKLYKIED